MSYTPTTWVNGDTITAEKLNKMEQGIANNSIFDIGWDEESDHSIAKAGEVEAAFNAGKTVKYVAPDGTGAYNLSYFTKGGDVTLLYEFYFGATRLTASGDDFLYFS